MKIRKLTLVVILIITSFQLFSQLKIDGQFRPRFEFRDGYNNLTNDTSSYSAHISQRTRLGLSFSKDKFTSRISFQDVRIWGAQKAKTMTIFPTAYELWFGVKFNKNWNVKIGRQELVYDNQRMVGTSNYNQIGQTHDAVKLIFKKNDFTLNYVAAFNQNKALFDGTFYETPDFYKTLNILWLSYGKENFRVSSLNIADGMQDPYNANSVYQRYTQGLIIALKYKMFVFNVRSFVQLGKNAANEDVKASYHNAEAKFKPLRNLTSTFGVEYRSGNDIETEDRNDFVLFISSNHSFNGKIDYFNFASATKGTGLIDKYIKLNYKVNENLKLLVDYHNFSSQQNYIMDGVEYDKYLGSEVDLEAVYKFDKLTVSALYAIIFADEPVAAMRGGDHTKPGNYFSVMLTYKPVFLNN